MLQKQKCPNAIVLCATVLCLGMGLVAEEAAAQAGVSNGDGPVLAALSPVGSGNGWGRLQMHRLGQRPLVMVTGQVFGLEPQQSYVLLLDGDHALDLYTDQLGDARFEAIVSRQEADPGASRDRQAADSKAFGLTTAAILDDSLAAVLEAELIPVGDTNGSAAFRQAERISLQDVGGIGAAGIARVERRLAGPQLFETVVTGLQPGATYHVSLDGVLLAVATSDQVGQAEVKLQAPDASNPLPELLQPVEKSVVVEWTDNSGNAVLSGTFAGEPARTTMLRGTVESVAESGFVLVLADEAAPAVTVTVDEQTRWAGGLTSIADLQPGTRVHVDGQLDDTGNLLASLVAAAEVSRGRPLVVRGTVGLVEEASFVLVAEHDGEENSLTVLVGEQTRWAGGLTGIADLQPGLRVQAGGELSDEGHLRAWVVIGEEGWPDPVVVTGTVRTVAEASFVIDAGDSGTPVTVEVGERTRWGGVATGIGDLQPGMKVHVQGERTAERTILARLVIARPEASLVSGTVESVAEASFVLVVDDDQGEAVATTTVTVTVGEQTRWAGGLSGIGDLQPGMRVNVAGELTAEGSILAWLVAGEERRPRLVTGTVESVAEASFVLVPASGGSEGTVTVQVNEQTQWTGGLTGIGDLQPGMEIDVAGELNADGSILARLVVGRERPQPVHLTGTVESVAETSFILLTDNGTLTVEVGERTRWAGGLTGIADLAAGMNVTVVGERASEGIIHAWLVAGEEEPPEPVHVRGTVESVAEASFILSNDQGTLTIEVGERTQWAGGLTGIGDLQPAMTVTVTGVRAGEGVLRAWLVAGEEQPPDPVHVRGTVDSVAEASFVLSNDGGTLTVEVGERTRWAGGLTGIGDLQPGMTVTVTGVLAGEGILRALLVAGEDQPPEPVHVRGTVDSVTEASFVLSNDEGTLTIEVGERTRWAGGLTGIGDLQPGMTVTVTGVRADEGVLRALLVAGEDQPPEPVHVHGTVQSVASTSFVLLGDDGNLLTVEVTGRTRWAGNLTGIGDLEPDMTVTVAGVRVSEGTIRALHVAGEGGRGH